MRKIHGARHVALAEQFGTDLILPAFAARSAFAPLSALFGRGSLIAFLCIRFLRVRIFGGYILGDRRE